MEIRLLQYYLAVVQEGSITGAARTLHITQPTLYKQLKELEDELGKQLIIRGSKRISLTDEGQLFRKRAQEIMDLVTKTELEIGSDNLSGSVSIGCGETEGMRMVAKTINEMQKSSPQVRFNLFSGNASDVMERLDKGLLDFGVVFGNPSLNDYESKLLPFVDRGGLLMRKDSPLASRSVIKPDDLLDIPLIVSRTLV